MQQNPDFFNFPGKQTKVSVRTRKFKVVLTAESLDESLKCGHSNENYSLRVLSCGAVSYYTVGGSTF